jgi:hypothetical protein
MGNNHPFFFMVSSRRSGTHAIRSVFSQLKVYEEIFNQSLQRSVEGDFKRFLDSFMRADKNWSLTRKFAEEAIYQYFKYIESF